MTDSIALHQRFSMVTTLCVGLLAAAVQGARTPAVPTPAQIGLGNRQGAIALTRGRTTFVEKVGVADCRVLRAFIHHPIDGRLDSRHYPNGLVWEYPNPRFDGVHYEYNNGDGLHMRLADNRGFDAVLIRGGYVGKMYRDVNALDGPGDKGVLLAEVKSQHSVFRKKFRKRVRTGKVSFFQPRRVGYFADVSFFRIKSAASVREFGKPAIHRVGAPTKANSRIRPWLKARFGKNQRVFRAGGKAATAFSLKRGEFVHVVTPGLDWRKGLVAIGLDINLTRAQPGQLLTVRVQDPLNPRRELMGVDFVVPGKGNYRMILDIPDQVFLQPPGHGVPESILKDPAPPRVLWISIAADAPAEIARATVSLYRSSREKALPEALALRKLLLKGYFYQMSEPRPWGGMKPWTDVREYLRTTRGGRYSEGLEQLFETLEICRALAPKDDIVRQYYDWLYERKLREKLGPWPIKVPEEPDAPRWAVLGREAFRCASAIPRWWIENRMAPNGELGGWVSDDSDMFQNWAWFPLIEDAPLGDMILDGARRLGEQALATRLEHGLNKRTTDPLHAYEEGTNHLSLCAWWFYGDPVHFERVMEAAKSVPKLTVIGHDGRRHFHGERIGAADLKKMGKIDREYRRHPLMLHPVYEVAWYNRNPKALGFLAEWAEAWIAYQRPGRWVTSIEVKTGKILKSQKRPGGVIFSGPGHAWFAAYQVTRDGRFLKPHFLALGAGGFHSDWWSSLPDLVTAPAFGSKLNALRKSYAGAGYGGFLLTGNKKPLETDLENAIREYQRLGHIYTAAEQYTDRIFLRKFAPVALCYLGSHTTRGRWFHNHAVSYEGLGNNFAALVYKIKPDALKVAIFNFNREPLKGRMRVWRLDHGRYKVRTGPDADDNGDLDRVEKESTEELCRYAPISLNLPPRRMTLIKINQTQKLDDIRDRADLALSPLDMRSKPDGTLHVRVHNIGAKRARNIVVAVMRHGRKVAEQRIPSLAAPLDLTPRTATLSFTNVRSGDEIVVDPADAVPEIAEHNNQFRVP